MLLGRTLRVGLGRAKLQLAHYSVPEGTFHLQKSIRHFKRNKYAIVKPSKKKKKIDSNQPGSMAVRLHGCQEWYDSQGLSVASVSHIPRTESSHYVHRLQQRM